MDGPTSVVATVASRWMGQGLRTNSNSVHALVSVAMVLGHFMVVASADGSQTAILPLDAALDQAALIAHVRVAGSMSFGEQPAVFVEIIQSARGPAAGQMAIVSQPASEHEPARAWKPGEQYILFAELKDDGFHHPLPGDAGRWVVARDGALPDTKTVRAIIPPQLPATAAGAIAHLAEECRRRDVRLEVRLNERELRSYEQGDPLHVEIRVENVGEGMLRLPNHIEYEFRHAHWVDLRMRRERMIQRAAPSVKICLQPLGRLSQLAEEARLERLADDLALAPGQRATANYDLGEEYGLDGGGRFLVWAELGAHRSPPVLLELPESDVAEVVMAMEELAINDGGPFRVAQGAAPPGRVMPPVEPTLHAVAIDAALAWWFHRGAGKRDNDQQPDEVVLLRPALLPAEFPLSVEGVHFAVSELRWRRDGEPIDLQTSQGQARFAYRTVEIKSIHVQGNRASVEVIQNRRHNLGGSGATIEMHRVDGRWRVNDRVLVWES